MGNRVKNDIIWYIMVKESQNLAALFGPEYKGVFDGVTGDISEAAPPAGISG